MTYKQIYNQLNRAGLIDKLVIETGDQPGIIKGIEYLEYFLGSHTFHTMGYWPSPNANQTICKVCDEYAKMQLANNKKHMDKYEYMLAH